MPAFAIWNYDGLLRSNRLARLLFERSTALYLSDAGAVRDLLERGADAGEFDLGGAVRLRRRHLGRAAWSQGPAD